MNASDRKSFREALADYLHNAQEKKSLQAESDKVNEIDIKREGDPLWGEEWNRLRNILGLPMCATRTEVEDVVYQHTKPPL